MGARGAPVVPPASSPHHLGDSGGLHPQYAPGPGGRPRTWIGTLLCRCRRGRGRVARHLAGIPEVSRHPLKLVGDSTSISANLHEFQEGIKLVEGDNTLFQADPIIPRQNSSIPPDLPFLGDIQNRGETPVVYDIILCDSKKQEIKIKKDEMITPHSCQGIRNRILPKDLLVSSFKNWKIILRVHGALEECFARPHAIFINFIIKKSSEYTEIPGNRFKAFPEKNVTYITIWVNGEPVGQEAILWRNKRLWQDGMFIRKDMRNKDVFFALAKEIIYESSKVSDFAWFKSINTLPDNFFRRNNFGTKRQVMSVEYKSIPISLARWKEFKEKKGLTDATGFATTIRDDLRNLDPY